MRQNKSASGRDRFTQAILEITQPVALLSAVVAAAAAAARFTGGL